VWSSGERSGGGAKERVATPEPKRTPTGARECGQSPDGSCGATARQWMAGSEESGRATGRTHESGRPEDGAPSRCRARTRSHAAVSEAREGEERTRTETWRQAEGRERETLDARGNGKRVERTMVNGGSATKRR